MMSACSSRVPVLSVAGGAGDAPVDAVFAAGRQWGSHWKNPHGQLKRPVLLTQTLLKRDNRKAAQNAQLKTRLQALKLGKATSAWWTRIPSWACGLLALGAVAAVLLFRQQRKRGRESAARRADLVRRLDASILADQKVGMVPASEAAAATSSTNASASEPPTPEKCQQEVSEEAAASASGVSTADATIPTATAAPPDRAPSTPASSVSSEAVVTPKVTPEIVALADGFEVAVTPDAASAAAMLVAETAATAREAIAEKGAFSLAVSGGLELTTALKSLASQPGLDFSKFHVLFCDEELVGLPRLKEARDTWLDACGVPQDQVHAASEKPAEFAAAEYTATICMLDEEVVGDSPDGLPSVDLMLLLAAEDGGCGGVRPDSDDARETGKGRVVLFNDGSAEVPARLAVSIDFMNASRRVLVLASGGQANVVTKVLVDETTAGPDCPVKLVHAARTRWILAGDSAEAFLAASASSN